MKKVLVITMKATITIAIMITKTKNEKDNNNPRTLITKASCSTEPRVEWACKQSYEHSRKVHSSTQLEHEWCA